MRPYRKIFISAIVITAMLFWYDYRHDDTRGLTCKQAFFEIAVWGGLYVIAIFLVGSLLYFCYSKIAGFFRRRG